MAGFGADRPRGLRRRSLPAGTVLWRIDHEPPAAWDWGGFASPRFRFDPASGAFRTRYAAGTFAGCARERYADTGRFIPAADAAASVVRLEATRPLTVCDLRTERNLDALGLDDRISTGHEAAVWDACQHLVDALRGWWEDLDGVVYRSPTTPATCNVAFFAADAFHVGASPLGECTDELEDLVLHHRFTLGFPLRR